MPDLYPDCSPQKHTCVCVRVCAVAYARGSLPECALYVCQVLLWLWQAVWCVLQQQQQAVEYADEAVSRPQVGFSTRAWGPKVGQGAATGAQHRHTLAQATTWEEGGGGGHRGGGEGLSSA